MAASQKDVEGDITRDIDEMATKKSGAVESADIESAEASIAKLERASVGPSVAYCGVGVSAEISESGNISASRNISAI